jgi:hypothetical protein
VPKWESLLVGESVRIKPKGKNAASPQRATPIKSADLRGWPAIAQFLGMPDSTAHRWAKEGMPVRRDGRNVVASPDELNQWLQQTSGEAAGVHVAIAGADLLKDLRASLAAQGTQDSRPHSVNKRRGPGIKAREKKVSRKPSR